MKLIFDMDGTLIDTAKATVPAVWRVADEFGFPRVSAAVIEECIGIPNPAFYLAMYPDQPRERVLAFGERVEAVEEELISTLGPRMAFTDMHGMLRALAAQGHTLYIASTGSPEHVGAALGATDMTGYFAGIHCGGDKTAAVAKILAGDKGLMVGDRKGDLRAAHRNGIACWGAAFGYAKHRDMPFFDAGYFTPQALVAAAAEL